MSSTPEKAQVSEADPYGALADAVVDLCWRAVPYGETEDGDVRFYLFTKGTVHRLIGAAQGAGIPAAFRATECADHVSTRPESGNPS